MKNSFKIVLLALIAVQLMIFGCQAAELKKTAQKEPAINKDDDSMALSKKTNSILPVFVLRKEGDKPDFFLIWMEPYKQAIPKPMLDMIDSQVRPQTEQISGQIISNVPGAEQVWSQMSQFQNILGQFNMGSLMGGSGGSSSDGDNPLSSLMGNLGRRR